MLESERWGGRAVLDFLAEPGRGPRDPERGGTNGLPACTEIKSNLSAADNVKTSSPKETRTNSQTETRSSETQLTTEEYGRNLLARS